MRALAARPLRSFSAVAAARTPQANDVMFIDGVRTPFQMSGTGFKNLLAVELARSALAGLVTKTAVEPNSLGAVVLGTVIQEVKTSNLAREASLSASLPLGVPAHTVSMACISSNAAIASVAEGIAGGRISSGVAAGAETMSDVPIRLARPARALLLASQKARGAAGLAALAAKITPAMFSLELPAIAEYSTGEVMGHSSDRLAAAWNVSRSAQDDFAHRSHSLAAAAAAAGKLARDLVPCGGVALADNGVKVAPREKLAALKPAFVKPHGTHTAANSSFLTDGASAALLMSRSAAAAAGHAPRARLVDWAFVACDPVDELLLGPAYAVTRLLAKHQLAAADVDVWEIHEAFAGQVLANLAALDSAWFVRDKVGLPEAAKVGALPMDRVNAWGGSLALGHPFGATGVRLLTTAANRLHDGGGRFAVLAACAAGGLGHAMLIERAAGAAAATA